MAALDIIVRPPFAQAKTLPAIRLDRARRFSDRLAPAGR
jgi:hypothetical protein